MQELERLKETSTAQKKQMTCTIRERDARIAALELQTRLLTERLSTAERELAEARRKGTLYSQTIARLR